MYIDLHIHLVITTQFLETGRTVFSFPPLYCHKQSSRGAVQNSYFALAVKTFKNTCEGILPFLVKLEAGGSLFNMIFLAQVAESLQHRAFHYSASNFVEELSVNASIFRNLSKT